MKPSSYLPELGTYEAFAFDELCAVVLSMREKEAMDEIRNKREGKGTTKGPRRFVSKEIPEGVDTLEWMKQFS